MGRCMSINLPNFSIHLQRLKIIPSKTLQYKPCFGQFQCARLEVPLDWNETTSGEGGKVAIAIVKKPAIIDVTDPRYGGVILFNLLGNIPSLASLPN